MRQTVVDLARVNEVCKLRTERGQWTATNDWGTFIAPYNLLQAAATDEVVRRAQQRDLDRYGLPVAITQPFAVSA